MKSIIAINKKFMSLNPTELNEIVTKSSKYIEGYEIYVDYTNKEELKYLDELAFICHKENLHFQVHGNSSLPLEIQIEYMKYLENIADYLGYKINIVLHSISAPTINESIKLTTDYLEALTNETDENKVIISLENLNDSGNIDRLDKNDITPIVANNEKVYLTYDIGHEIADYSNLLTINSEIIPLISNVHIHTFNSFFSEGYDHKPIFKNDEHWNEIIKGILFLKRNNYDKSIVFEYDLNTCPGNNIEERIISYCESIDYVSERIKG